MLIHKRIREDIAELLKTKLGVSAEFSAGRPAFIDLDTDPTAIAVFIDEATREEVTMCESEWTAQLNIAIYHKSLTGEGALDEIAENVVKLLADNELESLDSLDLERYSYEQDTQQRTWYIANLQYKINYTN